MGKTVTLRCDCGCNIKATNHEKKGWFKLSQLNPKLVATNDPKVRRKLYFSSIECLVKWGGKAIEDIPELREAGQGLRPRGTFRSEKASGLEI